MVAHLTGCSRRTRRRGAVMGAAALIALAAIGLGAQAPSAAPPPTLTIDVQVVDRDGLPIPGIAAEKFDIEVAGRKRRVVSASLVQAASATTADASSERQVYFVAVDALTFGPGASRAAIDATKALVETLPKGSLVGLVTFPGGPAVELTADRGAIATALDGLAGQRQAQRSGSMGVTTADAMEYIAANDRTAITQRICGTEEDNACPSLLEQEVAVVINTLETQARSSLGMLSEFTGRLGQIPGRKVLILVSGGLAAAERPGGRPDVGNLPTTIGEAATRSNVAIYTLLLDRIRDFDRADNQSARQASGATNERDLLARWLDQFSTSAGGAMVKVQVGQTSGSDVYARIARETAAFYRLTVESTDADRSERPLRLRVRVDQRGATVRSRTQVAGR